MRVLRADRYPAVPWKNGGGTTREIAVHRDPRRPAEFLWRLSIATVAQSGAFSRFDNVDRTIALLSGEGMVLHSAGGSVRVTAETSPFSFPGESEMSCELLGDPTIDLNAMTRRDAFRHSLRREQFTGWTRVDGVACQTLVVSNGLLEVSARGRDILRPFDTIAGISAGTTIELYSDRATEIFIVELMPQNAVAPA